MSDDLRTDDDIARLFADANPIPKHRGTSSEWRRPARSTEHESWGELTIELEEPTERVTEPVTGHEPGRRWLLAAAVVALIVSLAVTTWGGGDDEASVDEPDSSPAGITTPDTLPPTRLAVVDAFMDALSAYDAAAMGRTLAPGVVPALMPGADSSGAGTASIDDQLAFLAAIGASQDVESCRGHGESGVYCSVGRRDRLTDLVPFEMPGTMLFGFEDGLIVELVGTTEFGAYLSEALIPFYDWVLENHPDDVERLWTQASSAGFDVVPIITKDAAELMDERLTQYIAAYNAARSAAR